ncbi:N-6 DNA methylase [Candidatus Bathyarchaeota archaeon]|nr:N-6 DNA methylase [Candidatus Bathyarchaeota archaeon]
MATLFFLVSGENPTLPTSEVKSILESEKIIYKTLDGLPQIFRIEANPKCLEIVQRRASMTRIAGIEIFKCKDEMEEIERCFEKSSIAPYLNEEESFAVRVKRVRGSSIEIRREKLERELGDKILSKTKKTKVSLKNPQKTFLCLLSGGYLLFGLKKFEIRAKGFIKRGGVGKVFTHPAEMTPKLARCMVNLAHAKTGDVVLDPFCGTGSFLLEAGLVGCRVLGFDVLRSMVRGSSRNLAFYGVNLEGLIVADIRSPPLRYRMVDCIVTDPPYGTSATTLGLGRRKVFKRFLSAAAKLVKNNGRICFAAPKTVNAKKIGEQLGFRHVESHFIYIHRSLTREIVVFQLAR